MRRREVKRLIMVRSHDPVRPDYVLGAFTFDLLEHRRQIFEISREICPWVAQCIGKVGAFLQAQAVKIIQRFRSNFISAILSFHRFDPCIFGSADIQSASL